MARKYWACDRCGRLLTFSEEAHHIIMRKQPINRKGHLVRISTIAQGDYCPNCAKVIQDAMLAPKED